MLNILFEIFYSEYPSLPDPWHLYAATLPGLWGSGVLGFLKSGTSPDVGGSGHSEEEKRKQFLPPFTSQ